ncbi:MAG: D-alanine--D-alanine ligase A [Candidatus Cloacimonetes bacterium 4572_55]|nr:MAG: D-alanine--D-alanine ligase A [Candidatus Cloacimonetes bacterium 4572_55]
MKNAIVEKKIRVGILFGGKSAEHEISLLSAKNLVESINRDTYEVVLIGIDKSGRWHKFELTGRMNNTIFSSQTPVSDPIAQLQSVDVVFSILHGSIGEDGAMQGLLKIAETPFVGAGVLGSAVGMDKDVMKRLLRDADIPVCRFRVVTISEEKNLNFQDITKELGSILFVKPANMGSSVGVNRAVDSESFERAVQDAFRYDRKIIIEEFIDGREIECSVLGNDEPIASLPGEVIPRSNFYSYHAKYIDEEGAQLDIPAKLPVDITKKIQALSIRVFRTLCCEGMARVDFFLKPDGMILANEINTLPGFTQVSMYPKLWEVSGVNASELSDHLIQLALERGERERQLATSYVPAI